MGGRSKPRQAEYAPSATERTQAAIAKADADYFAQTYDPLLVEMRDRAATEDAAGTLRGRANADTMQALTGSPNLGIASDIDTAGDLATAATGQMLAANVAAGQAKRQDQLGVLSAARGQAGTAGDALAHASRLRASEDLTRIGQKQAIRRAKRQAAFDIGSAMAQQGVSNFAQTGSPFKYDLGYVRDANPLSATYGQVQQRYGSGLLGGFKSGTQPLQNAPYLSSITGGTGLPVTTTPHTGSDLGTSLVDYHMMRNRNRNTGYS